MIDTHKVVPIIESYKQNFTKHCEDEKYKWGQLGFFRIIRILTRPILKKCFRGQLRKYDTVSRQNADGAVRRYCEKLFYVTGEEKKGTKENLSSQRDFMYFVLL